MVTASKSWKRLAQEMNPLLTLYFLVWLFKLVGKKEKRVKRKLTVKTSRGNNNRNRVDLRKELQREAEKCLNTTY